jgi:hypothetical protein
MKLQRFKLFGFEESSSEDKTYSIVIPGGSILRKAVIFHDGIYIYNGTQIIKFLIANPKMDIPFNAKFIDILSTIMETKEGQGVIVFPIYQFTED